MTILQRTALVTVIVTIAVSALADEQNPALSNRPLSAEQNEVYKAFLSSYTNGSKSNHLNLGNRTILLDLSEIGNCLKGIEFESAETVSSTVHEFDSQSALPADVTLVDPKKQNSEVKENDPDRTMRQGKSVDQAVESAFASGLLSLSEIAFDKTHQYAVMSYSFVCGGLCGHGGTVIFQKVGGKWKPTYPPCRSWIS